MADGQEVSYFLELTEDEALLLEQLVQQNLDWSRNGGANETKYAAILLKLQALTQ